MLFIALAACSSATDPSQDSAPPIPAGFARFHGTIADPSGTAIEGAKVFVPFGRQQSWGALTDAQGQYEFDVRASDVAKVSPVAMVVYKDRYLPRTYYYTTVQEGETYSLTTDASNAPRVLAANEFVPENAYMLWHFGDESFSGSANSQLQVATSGTSGGFPVVQWSASLAQQYRSATLQFVARGVQSSLCPNDRFGVYADGGPMTSAVRPPDSDPNGGFTTYRLVVSLPSIPAGARLMFGAISGDCPNSGDKDDFEFAQVLVTLSN